MNGYELSYYGFCYSPAQPRCEGWVLTLKILVGVLLGCTGLVGFVSPPFFPRFEWVETERSFADMRQGCSFNLVGFESNCLFQSQVLGEAVWAVVPDWGADSCGYD
jgi:hypothetical protein